MFITEDELKKRAPNLFQDRYYRDFTNKNHNISRQNATNIIMTKLRVHKPFITDSANKRHLLTEDHIPETTALIDCAYHYTLADIYEFQGTEDFTLMRDEQVKLAEGLVTSLVISIDLDLDGKISNEEKFNLNKGYIRIDI